MGRGYVVRLTAKQRRELEAIVARRSNPAGLVRRAPHPDDRRAFQVEPTPAGVALHAELLEVVIGFNRRLTAGLIEDDLENLRASLAALEANVRPR